MKKKDRSDKFVEKRTTDGFFGMTIIGYDGKKYSTIDDLYKADQEWLNKNPKPKS